MSSEPDIIEISSDDTDNSDNGDDASHCPYSERSELVDGEISKSDDVKSVNKLSSTSTVQNQHPDLPSPKEDDFHDDSDEDCVILEDKPDNQFAAFGDLIDGGDEADDLLIVQEKGEHACRDYPHARNFCAIFPFSKTPHENHCDKCHCYVCDSPAPCINWGNGLLVDDHCHASDRDERWRVERQLSRKRRTNPPDSQWRTDITPPSKESTRKPNPQSHQDPLLLSSQGISSTCGLNSPTSNPKTRSLQDPILQSSQTTASGQLPNSPTATVRALTFKEKLYKELPFAYSFRRQISKPPSPVNPPKGPQTKLLIPSVEDVKREIHSGEESSSDDIQSHWSFKRARSVRSSSTSMDESQYSAFNHSDADRTQLQVSQSSGVKPVDDNRKIHSGEESSSDDMQSHRSYKRARSVSSTSMNESQYSAFNYSEAYRTRLQVSQSSGIKPVDDNRKIMQDGFENVAPNVRVSKPSIAGQNNSGDAWT